MEWNQRIGHIIVTLFMGLQMGGLMQKKISLKKYADKLT